MRFCSVVKINIAIAVACFGMLLPMGVGGTVLQNATMRCEVDDAHGSIVRVSTSGTDLIGSIVEHWNLQSPANVITDTTEASDAVSSIVHRSESEVAFTCTNAQLPAFTIIKIYTLDGDVLTKSVKVATTDAAPGLFNVKMEIDPLSLNYSSGGKYGVDSSPCYSPENTECLFWMDRWGPSGVRVMPVIVYPSLNATVGVCTYKIQGQFVFAREHDFFQPSSDRWLQNGGTKEFVTPSKDLIYEIQVRRVQGDALDFYRSYQALSDYQTLMSDQTDPDWFDRVRFVWDCGPTDLGVASTYPNHDYAPDEISVALGGDSRNALIWTVFGWDTLGQIPTSGQWTPYSPPNYQMDVDKVIWCRDQIRRNDSRRKFALYDWNRSYDATLPPFSSHPEYAAMDINGAVQHSFAYGLYPWWPSDAMPNYLNSGYAAYITGQYAAKKTVYGVDASYIDADVGDGYPDWNTRTVFQQRDRYNFLRSLRLAGGSETPSVRNSPNVPYGSGYYWEGTGLYYDGMENRWKAVGGKMLIDKIWQWQHRWTTFIVYNPQNEPYYSNYIVGLGYKPHAPDAPLRKYAYIQAGFEMRHLELVNADYSPCFWKNENTDTEVYLSKQGSGVYVTCIGHFAAEKTVPVTIKRSELPVSSSGPLFIWRINMDDPRVYPEPLNTEYLTRTASGENVVLDSVFVKQWTDRRVCNNEFLWQWDSSADQVVVNPSVRPGLLTMVAISDIPAIVVADAGKYSQMQVPSTADVTLGGSFSQQSQTSDITVQCSKPCVVALLSPAGLTIQTVKMNGNIVTTTDKLVGNVTYKTVNVLAGTQNVHVDYAAVQECEISEAKDRQNGNPVVCTGVISAIFGDSFYLESSDRTSGIRVQGQNGVFQQGSVVQVLGWMDETASYERTIRASSVRGG